VIVLTGSAPLRPSAIALRFARSSPRLGLRRLLGLRLGLLLGLRLRLLLSLRLRTPRLVPFRLIAVGIVPIARVC